MRELLLRKKKFDDVTEFENHCQGKRPVIR